MVPHSVGVLRVQKQGTGIHVPRGTLLDDQEIRGLCSLVDTEKSRIENLVPLPRDMTPALTSVLYPSR